MDKAQYDALMQDLANPDKSAAALVTLKGLVDTDSAAYENSQTQTQALNARIKDLQASNNSLSLEILKPAGGTESTPPEDKKPGDTYKELFADKFKTDDKGGAK